ncbi:MAG: NAD(P)H-dependent oxidoreductase subunit E [Nitrospinota bacterium]
MTKNVDSQVANEVIDLEFVSELLLKYKSSRGAIIPILQGIQTKFGYLPRGAVALMAKSTRMTVAQLFGVASFYAQFRMTPCGKYIFKICCGTACHVKGAQQLVQTAKEETGKELGETTDDKLITVERVACIGACSLAPVITVEDEAIGHISNSQFKELLEDYQSKEL